jgi:L-lactate dehydrogenase complex protein LldG
MAQAESHGRERILARIRSATGSAAPVQATREAKEVFARIEDPLARFRAECAANSTECIVAEDWTGGARALRDLLAGIPEGEVFAQDAPLLRRDGMLPDDRRIRWSSEGVPRESSQATVTLAEALVAETGSVLVSTACGGRAGSLVAPVHVVLAEAGQLVADLGGGLGRIQQDGTLSARSSVCLITGSSRTADIEKILVLGAHGPRRLVVVLSMRAG